MKEKQDQKGMGINKTVALSLLFLLATVSTAHAGASTPVAAGVLGSTFSTIAFNITNSMESLPGLLTGLAYLLGLMFGAFGVIKIKDHVENPRQIELKDGAIRLLAGGCLFALPIIYQSMFNTIGDDVSVDAARLAMVKFNVQ